MVKAAIQLPYFDYLLTEFADGNGDIETAFGRHVHWGYWADPQRADGTVEDFAQATEALTRLITNAADIHDRMRVLDAGCGFGGTIASLNERFTSMELVGINIDDRQLRRARQNVSAAKDNRIDFVQGNACELPFPNESFDAVVAVECIFHFPSREAFFKEAARVLKPGGKLALSDFVQPSRNPTWMTTLEALPRNVARLVYGRVNNCTLNDYAEIATRAGLKRCLAKDITAETLPTYDLLTSLINPNGIKGLAPKLVNSAVAWAQAHKWILYKVLAYEKPWDD